MGRSRTLQPRQLAWLLLCLCCATSLAAAAAPAARAPVSLSASELAAPALRVELAVSKSGPAATLQLRALPLRAGAARTWLDGAPLRRAGLRAFLGGDGARRVALGFDAHGALVHALQLDGGRLVALHAARTQGVVALHPAGTPLPAGHFDCLDAGAPPPAALLSPPPLVRRMQPADIHRWHAAKAIAGHQAVVAIEVDPSFMDLRFGDDAVAADAWLDALFLATNLIYERDLQLQLVRGETFLSTGTDPYPATSGTELLFQFGAYWRQHRAGVPRAFASLISGKTVGEPTGVSWIGQYCNTGTDVEQGPFGTVTAGSYGVNLANTADLPAAVTAELFGHELGHSLGAWHTHCTDTDPGDEAFTPIDRCDNTEQPADTCYRGTPACPTEFGGRGTLMSRCALLGTCGERLLQFHPVHIDLLTQQIAAHSPGCLAPAQLVDPAGIFHSGFESGE